MTVQAPAVAGTNTLTLPAATGNLLSDQSIVPGSSSVPTNGMYLPATNALGFATNSTNAMYIDSSQNVGIGTSSPTARLNILSAGNWSAANWGKGFYVNTSGSACNPAIGISDATGANNWAIVNLSGALTFNTGPAITDSTTAGTERMRIDSSGNLLVGATTAPTTFRVYSERSGLQYGLRHPSATAGQYFFMQTDSSNTFYIQSQAGNGVYLTNTGTSWTGVSDERLKTDLVPIENATSKVLSLRAVTGRFKTDEVGTSRAFLIAQDVQAVLPEAVDATNPDKLGVSYTEVIPLLVAAIKELSAKNDALEARLVALEAK